jgi:hypothetical protein
VGAVIDSTLVDEIGGRYEGTIAPNNGHDDRARRSRKERVVTHTTRYGTAQRLLVGA